MDKKIWMILGVILAIGMVSNAYAWGVATPPEKRYEVTLNRPYYVFEVQNMQGGEPIDVVMMVDCDGICTLRTTCNTCRLNANERKNFYIDFYTTSMTPNTDYNVDFYVKKVKSSDEGMIQFSQMMKKDFVAYWTGGSSQTVTATIEPSIIPSNIQSNNPVIINVGGNNVSNQNVSVGGSPEGNTSNDTAPVEETKTVDELEGKTGGFVMPPFAILGGILVVLACLSFVAYSHSRGWFFGKSNDGYTKRIFMILMVTVTLFPMLSASGLADTSETHSVALVLQEQYHTIIPTGLMTLVVAPIGLIFVMSLILAYLSGATKDPKTFIKMIVAFAIILFMIVIFGTMFIGG